LGLPSAFHVALMTVLSSAVGRRHGVARGEAARGVGCAAGNIRDEPGLEAAHHRSGEGQMAAFLASAAQLAQRGWRTGDPDDGP
jgi:hypothetical protein